MTVKPGLVLIALCLVCLWNAAPASSQKAGKTSQTLSDEQLAQAKTLFGARCSRCHGTDGRGQTEMGEMLGAPDFTDEKWQKAAKDERLTNSITNGKDAMPPFGKKLSAEEIALLVGYVRHFNKTGH